MDWTGARSTMALTIEELLGKQGSSVHPGMWEIGGVTVCQFAENPARRGWTPSSVLSRLRLGLTSRGRRAPLRRVRLCRLGLVRLARRLGWIGRFTRQQRRRTREAVRRD